MDESLPEHKDEKTWVLRPVASDESVPAWEMIEPGRYMPRRFKGSFPGRELG